MRYAILLATLAGLMLSCSTPSEPAPAAPVERPPIVGIANFVVKTNDMEHARAFYGAQLGYPEVFQHTRPGVEGEIAVFKVNDTEFIEVSPTLGNEQDDRLIQIGFETSDARGLRDYLEQEGYEVPADVRTDADGNLSFIVEDPEGHRVGIRAVSAGFDPEQERRREPRRGADLGPHPARRHSCLRRSERGLVLQGSARVPPLWKGGMTDEKVEWISLLVPDGSTWVEYMMADRE